ncbi:Uncharacterised protein [Mycobacteroides abscessus subsp. abscessus]|nr:Uncharacterised protein [Mycobacteroides abscessus subsp. abscessus]
MALPFHPVQCLAGGEKGARFQRAHDDCRVGVLENWRHHGVLKELPAVNEGNLHVPVDDVHGCAEYLCVDQAAAGGAVLTAQQPQACITVAAQMLGDIGPAVQGATLLFGKKLPIGARDVWGDPFGELAE